MKQINCLLARLAFGLTCVALAAGCGGNGPEEARSKPAQLGMTNSSAAFIKAVKDGDLVAVRVFLMAGLSANTRIETEDGSFAALHLAVNQRNKDIVALLLEKGADVNATSFGKDTPLHVALVQTNTDLALVKLLLNNGANLNAVREFGVTPLMQSVAGGNLEVVDLLLTKGAEVNAKAVEGYTALMIASIDGNLPAVRALLKFKLDLQAKGGPKRRTALEMAQVGGHRDVVETLRAASVKLDSAGFTSVPTTHAVDSPESARLKLGQMGLQFTADDFIRKSVWNSDMVAAKIFLDAGMDVNSSVPNKDGGSWTGLAFAAKKGNPEMVKLLLSRGARITTELFDAASGGNLETVKLLVHQGARVRVGWDELHGFTKAPLFIAAKQGHPEVVRFLLENGAYVSEFESIANVWFDESFLGAAIDHRQIEVVKVLIQAKIDCATPEAIRLALDSAKEMAERTPQNHVNTTRADTEKSKEILEILNSREGKKSTDMLGRNALLTASQTVSRLGGSVADSIQASPLLLNVAAPLQSRDIHGRSDLMIAAMNGYVVNVASLLTAGANVFAKDTNGTTALMVARNSEVAALLIGQGARTEETNVNGLTALMYAADRGDSNVVAFLLAKGANANARNNYGWTPIIYAQNPAVAELLLKKGANLEGLDYYGRTPLMNTASFGNSNVVALLLTNGAKVDARSTNGTTALMAARNATVAEMLISKGAKVDEVGEQGITALNQAAARDFADVAEILLTKGATIDRTNMYGRTALILAARNGSTNAVKVLLGKSADVGLADKDGMTALTYAATNGHSGIVTLLKKAGAQR